MLLCASLRSAEFWGSAGHRLFLLIRMGVVGSNPIRSFHFKASSLYTTQHLPNQKLTSRLLISSSYMTEPFPDKDIVARNNLIIRLPLSDGPFVSFWTPELRSKVKTSSTLYFVLYIRVYMSIICKPIHNSNTAQLQSPQ